MMTVWENARVMASVRLKACCLSTVHSVCDCCGLICLCEKPGGATPVRVAYRKHCSQRMISAPCSEPVSAHRSLPLLFVMAHPTTRLLFVRKKFRKVVISEQR